MKDMICVQQYTDEMSTPSKYTHKRRIHEHRYESAHLCACVKEKQRDPQVLTGGFMVLWAVFVATLRGSIPTGGHIAILGPPSGFVCPGFGVATAIATAFPIRCPLNTSGPPGQLSAQFSCYVRKTRISLLMQDHVAATSCLL